FFVVMRVARVVHVVITRAVRGVYVIITRALRSACATLTSCPQLPHAFTTRGTLSVYVFLTWLVLVPLVELVAVRRTLPKPRIHQCVRCSRGNIPLRKH